MAKVWFELARALSDSLVIPFNAVDYASTMAVGLSELDGRLRAAQMNRPDRIPDYDRVTENLQDALGRFRDAAYSVMFSLW